MEPGMYTERLSNVFNNIYENICYLKLRVIAFVQF